MVTQNVVRSGITRNVTRGVTESFFSGLTPQLHYDFLNTPSIANQVIGPDLSITRATKATVVKSDGLIHEVSAGVARFTGATYSGDTASGTSTKGILIEEARTQLAIWTEDISNAAWVASNITKGTTAVTAPDGASNSNVRLTASAANGTLLQTLTSASATRVYSVYMKRVTGTGNIDLTLDGGSTWTTQTLTSEWQRFYITQAAVTNPSFGVRIVTSGDAIDFWGSELNSGATFPTSYISNNSATASVTRNADDVSTTDVSWYSGGASTFYAHYLKDQSISNTRYVFDLGMGSTTESIQHNGSGTANQIVVFDGPAQAAINVAKGATAESKMAFGIDTNDFVLYVDGTAGTPDTSGTVPSDVIDRFYVGRLARAATQYWNGHIAEIRYYNTRLTNAQLEDMSNGVFP